MVDWSYVAGLFDHKGNLNILNANGREYFQLRIYSSHKATLEEVQKFLECGNIYQKELSKKNKNWNDSFELTITTKEDVYIVLTQILPYLVKRKQEIEKILKTHKLFKDFREVSNEVASEKSKPDKESDAPFENIAETDSQTANNDETGVQTFEEDISYIG